MACPDVLFQLFRRCAFKYGFHSFYGCFVWKGRKGGCVIVDRRGEMLMGEGRGEGRKDPAGLVPSYEAAATTMLCTTEGR